MQTHFVSKIMNQNIAVILQQFIMPKLVLLYKYQGSIQQKNSFKFTAKWL